MIILITKLNQVIRGWANYHRHVVAMRLDVLITMSMSNYGRCLGEDTLKNLQSGCIKSIGLPLETEVSLL